MRYRSVRRDRNPRRAAFGAGLLALIAAAPAAAGSLEVPPGEEEAIKACERQLCSVILDKAPEKGALTCDLQKTWAKSSLEGGKSKGVSWGFGDARCTVDLALSHADIVAALIKRRHTVKVPSHQVNCVVVREGEERPVTVKLAPKLAFKRGRADKVWINLESIEGPADVRATVWTAAQLEDTLGIFHRPLIRSINRFIHRRCEQRYGAGATEAKADDAKEEAEPKAASIALPKRKDRAAAAEAKETASAP